MRSFFFPDRPITPLIFLPLLLLSCEKTLSPDLLYEGDKIVLHAILNPNTAFQAQLTISLPPVGLQQEITYVQGASVRLVSETGNILALEEEAEGIYAAPLNWRPQTGVRYYLTASASGFPDIETTLVLVPTTPSISQFGFQDSAFTPSGSNNRSGGEINFSIPHNPSIPEYFHFEARFVWDSLIDPFAFLSVQEILAGNVSCGYGGGEFLSDACFVINPFPLSFRTSIPAVRRTGERPKQIEFVVAQTSESYFRYYELLNQPEDIELAFSEPAPSYSNVRGGYGLLGARHERVFQIILD